jgi:rubredoxin
MLTNRDLDIILNRVCPQCDIKPLYYRKLIEDRYWMNYCLCPKCGYIFNSKIEDINPLRQENEFIQLCRELALEV